MSSTVSIAPIFCLPRERFLFDFFAVLTICSAVCNAVTSFSFLHARRDEAVERSPANCW
jgi:hypothetical protein